MRLRCGFDVDIVLYMKTGPHQIDLPAITSARPPDNYSQTTMFGALRTAFRTQQPVSALKRYSIRGTRHFITSVDSAPSQELKTTFSWTFLRFLEPVSRLDLC